MKRSLRAIDFWRRAAMPPQRLRRQHRVDPAFERRQREHRRRAADEARHAGGRAVVGGELERRGVPEPARQRLPPLLPIHPRGVAGMGPDERRRARSAVQVLVAAADGEIGRVAGEIDRHRAGRVRQVPDRQRPGGVGGGGQLAHPVHPAGAVVDVGQHAAPRPARRDAPASRRRRPASARTRAPGPACRRCRDRSGNWCAPTRSGAGQGRRRRPARSRRSTPCRG